MKIKNKILYIFIIISLLVQNVTLKADEDIYEVYDAVNPSEKESFSSFSDANSYYKSVIDEFNNAVLKKNDDVVKMEYGIVEFKVNDTCTLETNYFSEYRKYNGVINGCYGIDGAYLESSNNGETVYFIISGDYGYTDYENVILHPYEELNTPISLYEVNNKQVSHSIKTQLNNEYYSFSINNGQTNLKDGKYFSYDGHYFYDDFYKMIDDYQGNDFENAINYEEPHYNYYQYLSHRSLTNYEYQEIEDFFYNQLHFYKKLESYKDASKDNANDIVNRSQYYGELKSFFEYQYLYGANALMMLSESINESSYGKSLSSFVRNNLFGHSAYESDEERNTSRYNSLESSVYSHAKHYISNSYSNHRKNTYYGSFFGNKTSGMNVMYSSDPYWGEKAANNYYRLDNALGDKDNNSNCIGIIQKKNSLTIYRDEDLKKSYYAMDNVREFAFVIIEEKENSYKVQLDPSFNSDYLYDFEKSIGYLNKEDFSLILNEDKMHSYDLVNVTFDGAGGMIAGSGTINIKVKKGSIPVINSAKKDGYEFVGFNPELDNTNVETTYVAQYKKINKIELQHPFEKNVEYGKPYNLQDGKIKIIYDDNSNKILDIDSQMLLNYDPELEGEQDSVISYCGLDIPIIMNNSKNISNLDVEITNKIKKNVSTYKNDQTFSEQDLKQIKNSLSGIDYYPLFSEVRLMDEMLLNDFDKKIFITAEKYDLSVSGLALSVVEPKGTLFNLLNNTYYVNAKDAKKQSYDRLYEVASAYDFEIIDAINISLSLNFQEAHIDGPVIVQLNIPDMKTDKIYSIYHLKDNGDVVKCRTTQTSNYIQFLTYEFGDFMIMCLDSPNTYVIEDNQENISITNDYFDNHGFITEIFTFISLSLIGFIIIVIYYRLKNKEDLKWDAYKRSLLTEDTVREEKRKN